MPKLNKAIETVFAMSTLASRARSQEDWEVLCSKTLQAILDLTGLDYAALAYKTDGYWRLQSVVKKNSLLPNILNLEDFLFNGFYSKIHAFKESGKIIQKNIVDLSESFDHKSFLKDYRTVFFIPVERFGEEVASIIGLSVDGYKIPQKVERIIFSLANQLGYPLALQITPTSDCRLQPCLPSENHETENLSLKIKRLTREREEMQKENQSLSLILRTLGAGLSIVDRNMKVVWVNDLMEKWFGPAKNIIGSNCYESFLNLARPCEDCPAIATFKTGQMCHAERSNVTLSKREGRIVETLTTPMIEPETGLISQVLCLIQDITEKKRNEEELRFLKELNENIIESANVGIAVVDKNLKILRCNSLMREFWQLQGKQPFTDELIKNLDNNKAEEFTRWINQVIELAQPIEIHNIVHPKLNGENIHSNLKISPLRDKDGHIYGAIILQENITPLKSLEEKLIQSEKLRALGQMASGVAHNLNNILSIIQGNIQLILDGLNHEEVREELKLVEKVARDGAQIIRRLHDFTRIKKDCCEFYTLDLNEVVKDAIEITQPKWKDQPQGKGIFIDLQAELSELPPVVGNASELREVMTNLIFNAVEAMPEGGRLLIKTRSDRGKVYLSICDTGRGVPEELKTRIFDPFFTTKGSQNTGLGLSASYGIVTRHRGKIEVQSMEGKGTTVILTLPESRDGVEPPTEVTEVIDKKKANILIIDDEARVSECLSEMFSRAGHYVKTALSAKEGWEVFNREKFDVVFTDLGMPGMSGWDLAGLIKHMSPTIPVVMMTGWSEDSFVEEDKSKVDFYITKPFEMGKIIGLVDKIMSLA